MPHIRQQVIFLMGPTASGKTQLATELAQHLNVRLISVDSALIYRGMDIGTAKPAPELLAKYPHHLIDICTPEQRYSAFDFITDAKAQILQAFAQQQLPVLVGGTSFYFYALQHGLSQLPQSSADSRAKFAQLLQSRGALALHQMLAEVDPIAAQRIHPNDTQRITRALEVFELSGKTLSELQGRKKSVIDFPLKKIILMPERAELHQRIEARFLAMMAHGFVAEVRNLRQRFELHADLPAMRCVGYRQAWQYLDGEIDEQTLIERAVIASRGLCKRQSTWLKSERDALVLERPDMAKILAWIEQ